MVEVPNGSGPCPGRDHGGNTSSERLFESAGFAVVDRSAPVIDLNIDLSIDLSIDLNKVQLLAHSGL